MSKLTDTNVFLTEWNGKPMIKIAKEEDDRFGFQFQLGKAKMIVDHIDAIREFVDSEGESIGQAKTKKKSPKASVNGNGKAKPSRKKVAVADDDEE